MDATNRYLESQDHLKMFIDECCVIDSKVSVKRNDLFDAYKSSNYFKSYPLKVSVFYTEMEKNYKAKKVLGTRMFEGISINKMLIEDEENNL